MGFNIEAFMQGLVCICLVVPMCLICVVLHHMYHLYHLYHLYPHLYPHLVLRFPAVCLLAASAALLYRLDLVMMWQKENLINFNCFVKTVPSNLNEDHVLKLA